MFDTARSRMIRELRPDAVRPWPLVDAEVKLHVSVLERMLADLRRRIMRITAVDGHAVVLDTNILLHYKPLIELPWNELTEAERVRVIVPLRVIEELDQKKYAPRKDLAARARRLLPQLRSWLGPAGAPAVIATNITIEVMVDGGPRRRPSDADEEILAACRELGQFGASAVSLLSADTAMQLRAQAEEIAVITLPDKYLRSPNPE
jgi:predicted ribonuclease YlaK